MPQCDITVTVILQAGDVNHLDIENEVQSDLNMGWLMPLMGFV